MKKLHKLLIVSIILILILSFCISCTQTEVRGIIVGSNSGKPISGYGLQLLIAEETNEGISFSWTEDNPHTETNSLGEFVFKDVTPGDYGLGTYPDPLNYIPFLVIVQDRVTILSD